MRIAHLISVSAAALLIGIGAAAAQSERPNGTRGTAAEPPAAIQNAPAEKIAPKRDRSTTGQGQSDRPGAAAPSGSQPDGERAGSRPGGQPATGASGGADTRTNTRNDTTGQGAAGTRAALTSDQRTKITTVIREQRVQPVTNVNFSISIGATVPRTVELHPLPATVIEVYPAWRGYHFVLVGGEIVVIDPGTYRIVAILEV